MGLLYYLRIHIKKEFGPDFGYLDDVRIAKGILLADGEPLAVWNGINWVLGDGRKYTDVIITED